MAMASYSPIPISASAGTATVATNADKYRPSCAVERQEEGVTGAGSGQDQQKLPPYPNPWGSLLPGRGFTSMTSLLVLCSLVVNTNHQGFCFPCSAVGLVKGTQEPGRGVA